RTRMTDTRSTEDIAPGLDTMGGWHRTHLCGELRASNAGNKAVLMGWVQRTRDHGGVVFIDLRDHSGITQIVFHPAQVSGADLAKARAARAEYVLAVRGPVVARPADMVNRDLATGEVEVDATQVRILNVSRTPPFPIEDDADVSED